METICGKVMHSIHFSIIMFTHSSCGADLGGLVLARQAALALWFFGPVSLQVRPDDGI